MSEADIIKEFLVKLGWKIDERSFKKFDEATGLSTKSVGKLGVSVVAVGAAVEAFAIKVAKSFDTLYWASKRTGSSAEEINAFGYAIGQMGGNADDAKSSLENLARFMRSNPGAGNFLTRALGVKPEHLKDAAKVMNDLAATFQRMPMYLATRYAGMLGIDEKTMLAMRDKGTLFGKEDAYAKMAAAAGVDQDALAKSSMEFINQLKTLESTFGLLTARLEQGLLPVMGKINGFLLGLAGDHPGTAAKGFVNWAGKHSYLPGLVDWIGEHSPFGGLFTGAESAGEAIGRRNIETRGIRNNNPGNLRSWGNTPRVGGFAAFPNAQAGLSAMARQLGLYGQRGVDTLTGIVSRWAPSSDGNNVAAYIGDMMKQTGFGAAQHLNMSDPDTLQRLMSGIIMHENGRNPYSPGMIAAGARSGANATLHQKTEIKIMGGDAQGTARAVAGMQDGVNQNAVRNLAGAVQ